MNRMFCALMMVITTMIMRHSTVQAQPAADWLMLQDSVEFLLVQNGDTTSASWVSPSYDYEMVYDSCRTQFLFSECKKNGELVKLLSWNHGRTVHVPQELMSFNSRTANVLVHTGDTISFYRQMEWYNPATNEMLTTNYYSLDTLEMIVYLVDASNGNPLAQLDSLGVLPRTTRGAPTIYGSRPIMALVSYVVPPSLDGDSVLVGITIRAKGSGAYHFTRYDGITVGLSERLRDANYHTYLAGFGSVYAKRSLNDLMRGSGEEGALLTVSSSHGSPGDIHITFNGPKDGGATAVAIYDEAGDLVFCPYNSHTNERQSATSYRIPKNGAYFVTLIHNGRIVKTQKAIITK